MCLSLIFSIMTAGYQKVMQTLSAPSSSLLCYFGRCISIFLNAMAVQHNVTHLRHVHVGGIWDHVFHGHTLRSLGLKIWSKLDIFWSTLIYKTWQMLTDYIFYFTKDWLKQPLKFISPFQQNCLPKFSCPNFNLRISL